MPPATRDRCERTAAARPWTPETVGRRVFCPRDMPAWESTEAFADVVAFVDRMNAAAAAADTTGRVVVREPDAATGNADATAEVLRHVGQWATDEQSFEHFHATLRDRGRGLLSRAYGPGGGHRDHRFAELPAYLETSFGDPVATAYGPEHELSFSMFLAALFKLGPLTRADEPYVVSVLFDRYLDVVDCLIRSFRLAPSSMHGGSPGLDDYRFLGFVWGSAQLMGRDECGGDPSPATAVTATDESLALSDKRMFAKCVDAAHRREGDRDSGGGGGGPMWWHSYRLWNLSASGRWDRVNRRLVAAYRRDVLRRFDVVRYLVFGQLLRYVPRREGGELRLYDDRMIGTELHEAIEEYE